LSFLATLIPSLLVCPPLAQPRTWRPASAGPTPRHHPRRIG